MAPKLTEPALKNIIMKIIKLLCIISFLLISSLGDNGQPIIIILFLYCYQLINDLLHFTTTPFIFWEGIIVIPVIGTLIILAFFKRYKNKFLLYLCILALLVSIIELTGIINSLHLEVRPTLSFTVPFIIFITSSIILIIKYSKKREV